MEGPEERSRLISQPGSTVAEPEALDDSGRTLARVFLIRHADASVGPKDGEGGRHLTPLGELQAAALARRIAGWDVDAIVCSDKHRSRETGVAIQRFHPHVPLIVDETFREASKENIQAHEEGDSEQKDLFTRLEQAWDKLIHPSNGVTLLILHNGLIKYLLGRTIRCQAPIKPRFHCTETGITGIQITPKGPLLDFFNDTRHLAPDLVTPGTKVPWFERVPTVLDLLARSDERARAAPFPTDARAPGARDRRSPR
jgi:broad specificity phosphatase PhoE